MAKVKLEHLTKIFGKHVKQVTEMMQEHAPKTDILEKLVQRLVFMMPT
ncbi:Uncharacterised protein [Weissella viridescens]|uniref:Uncharacterized protein n=1 Tax=Weissella viridescens TaxID=1629 RepID=A0A380P8I3_WEIVI|nr:Uncharacterised protein [Weissella viridescens]